MDLEQRVMTLLQQSIDSRTTASEWLPEFISDAADLIAETLLAEGKMFVHGDRTTRKVAAQLHGWMLTSVSQPRPGLPCIHIGEHNSRAIEHTTNELKTFAQPGDVLFITASSNTRSKLHEVIVAAHQYEVTVIALTHENNDDFNALLHDQDILLPIPATVDNDGATVDLMMFIVWAVTDLVEAIIFGPQDE